MSQTVLHRAETRGHRNHGWLEAKHTFSFADYFEPSRVQFGALRVLNDDIIQPGQGFGTHPHSNMEIVTIPIQGALEHKDSLGSGSVIRKNEVQHMSAGSGILHSEFNPSRDEPVNLLQIWVFPAKKNITPQYDQKAFDPAGRKNQFQFIASPTHEGAVPMHQDAFFSLIDLQEGESAEYQFQKSGNGAYLFLIEGQLLVEGNLLNRRDGLGVWDTSKILVRAENAAELLVMEVPMI